MDIFDTMIFYFKFFCAIFIITAVLDKLLFKSSSTSDKYYSNREIEESNERFRKCISIIKSISLFFTAAIGIIGLFLVIVVLGLGGAGGSSGGSSSYSSGDDNIHHVNPHEVDDYYRQDGTHVDGYHRGGEDGYYRSNPDGRTDNNLNSR